MQIILTTDDHNDATLRQAASLLRRAARFVAASVADDDLAAIDNELLGEPVVLQAPGVRLTIA